MGTRGNFIIQYRNGDMEWLGSIASDCYPSNFESGLRATSMEDFRREVNNWIEEVDCGTVPSQGYPFAGEFAGSCSSTFVYREKYNKTFLFVRSDGSKGDQGYFIDLEQEPDVCLPSFREIKRYTRGERAGSIMIMGSTPDGLKVMNYSDTIADRDYSQYSYFKVCEFCSGYIQPITKTCSCSLYGIEMLGEEKKEFLRQYEKSILDEMKKQEDMEYLECQIDMIRYRVLRREDPIRYKVFLLRLFRIDQDRYPFFFQKFKPIAEKFSSLKMYEKETFNELAFLISKVIKKLEYFPNRNNRDIHKLQSSFFKIGSSLGEFILKKETWRIESCIKDIEILLADFFMEIELMKDEDYE